MLRAAGERQFLGKAVLASILLHAMLLSALPGWREWQGVAAPAPILARVLPAQPSAESVAEVPPKRPALEPDSSLFHSRPASPRPSQPHRQAREHEPAAPALRSDPVSPPAGPTAADAGSLAQYRLAIISIAKDYNRYPRIAVEHGWEGRVEVRMSVAPDGAIASIALRRASGHEILDRQALDMIGTAAPQVALPVSLRGREFAIDIPVIFSLKQTER